METFTSILALVGLVIIAGSLISGGVEKHGLPLVAAFLALGAALGPLGLGITDITLETPALRVLSMLGLALVLFSDAVTIDARELRARWSLVWRLLGPGTLLSAALITVAARVLLSVTWPAAVMLGASLASTDPVLLRSILRTPTLPASTRLALRIETGMNDVVLLPIVILAMLTVGTAQGHGERNMAQSLVGLFVLGPVLGVLIGWVGIRMLSSVRRSVGVRRDYESLYALGLAFTAFSAAETAGGSGFLAAFAAGLMVNAQDEELCECFLEYGEATAEMLLLLTFVALGTSLIWTGVQVMSLPTILFALVAVTVRTAVLFPVLSGVGMSQRDRRLIAIFGPRGLSSLLLILLPVFAGIEGAPYLFTVTCLVVLVSLVLHGTAMALFLRRTGANAEPAASAAPRLPAATAAAPDNAPEAPVLITLEELANGRRDGVVVADSRQKYLDSGIRAEGSVRLHPDNAASDAASLGIDKRATIAVYCA
jgi:sodium/hydrogen antiporter